MKKNGHSAIQKNKTKNTTNTKKKQIRIVSKKNIHFDVNRMGEAT